MSIPRIILQLIKIADDEYAAQIIESPRGGSSPGFFKLTAADQVIRMGDDRGPTLKELKDSIDGCTVTFPQMELLGEFLYNKVFVSGGKVERKLFDIMIQEKERPYRLCVRVDENAPLLETIPWEYMKHQEGFIARKVAYVTRVLEDRQPKPFDPAEEVTMLLVYANRPGYGGPTRYQEIEKASNAFIPEFIAQLRNSYNVKLTELLNAQATSANFLDALSQNHYDIVHFIGHGEVVQGLGHIVLHDYRITGMEIYERLSDQPPRLCYFNSCSTAKANDRDAFSSVAQALLKPESNSVPAVIAMQYEIDVNDSFVLATEFYQRLLKPDSPTRGNLEKALYEARRITKLKNPSWGIPVLFLHTHERVMLFGEPPPPLPPSSFKLHLHSDIPPPNPNLIDRRDEIAAVRQALRSHQPLTILTGLPGVGRGAIVRAALDLSVQDEEEEEICIWINFEGLKIEDATLDTLYLSLDHILESGLKQLWHDQRRGIDEKLKALEEKIPQGTILVLENLDVLLDEERCFRGEQTERFFRQFAATTQGVSIVATSRFKPGLGSEAKEEQMEWNVIAVKGLDVEGALLLLRQEGLTQSDEQLRQLCEAYDGHPQALKIVASAVREENLDPEQFLRMPYAKGKAFVGFGETVLGALSETEHHCLKIWAVFRNPVLREGLVFVANDRSNIEEIIDSLATKGILQLRNNYYSLPLLIRDVLIDRLRRDPQLCDLAHLHAAQFFIQQSASSQLLPVFAATDEFINDQLETRYHLLERSDEDSHLYAQEITKGLFQSLMDRDRHQELRVLIEQSPSEIRDGFEVQFFGAQLKGVTGSYEEALDILGLLDLTVEQNSFEHASVKNEIGVVLKERSDPRDSDLMLQSFDEAYEMFRHVIRSNDDEELLARAHWSQAIATYNRGLVYQYFRRGRTPEEFNNAYGQARLFYEAAIDIFNKLEEPDERGIAQAYSQLGEMYSDNRYKDYDLEKAENLLTEAVELAERAGNPRVQMDAAYQLARFRRRNGDLENARILFRGVADQAVQIDLFAEQAIAEVQIAEIDFSTNQYDRETLDRALSRYEERLGYYDDWHSIRVQSDAYFLHGLLQMTLANTERALELFESSRAVMFTVAEKSQSGADARRIARVTSYLAEDQSEDAQNKAGAIVAAEQESVQLVGVEPGDDQAASEFLEEENKLNE